MLDDITDEKSTKSILSRMWQKNIDTNYSYFVELCKRENLTFITHDIDFKTYDCEIKILTGNKKYYC